MRGVHNFEYQLYQRNDGTIVAGISGNKCYCGYQKRFFKLREEQRWEEASNVKCSCIMDTDIVNQYTHNSKICITQKDKFKMSHTKFTYDGTEDLSNHRVTKVSNWLYEHDMKVKIK